MPFIKTQYDLCKLFKVKGQTRKITLLDGKEAISKCKYMQWWKYFDKVVSNSDIHKVNIYLQIVAALCNCCCPSLRKNSNAYCEIVKKMLKIKSRNSCTETCSKW